jgi:ParB family transcriptional regulator, chromosome partitioning protein
VVRQSGLGKGLGALIPSGPEDDRFESGAGIPWTRLVDLPVESILPNRFQTRDVFDEESLDELTASIKEVGVLQPILVRPSTSGTYELIAGERRWRAARRAGLAKIPALVRDTTDNMSVAQVLIENLQREDLDPLEEAAGFQQMVAELNLTHEEVAAKVGRSRAAVTNGLRLLQLSPAIQKMLKTRELSSGHARALLALSDKSYQESLAKRAVSEGLTVRQIEAAVALRQELASGRSGKTKKSMSSGGAAAPKPAGLLELEDILGSQLDTRVAIELGAKNGRIQIEFADIEDLERIFQIISAVGTEAEASDGEDVDRQVDLTD